MTDDAQVRKEQEEFKTEVFERLASLKQPDGLHSRRKAVSVVGTKPLVDQEGP